MIHIGIATDKRSRAAAVVLYPFSTTVPGTSSRKHYKKQFTAWAIAENPSVERAMVCVLYRVLEQLKYKGIMLDKRSISIAPYSPPAPVPQAEYQTTKAVNAAETVLSMEEPWKC
jgi:hypothetical protein